MFNPYPYPMPHHLAYIFAFFLSGCALLRPSPHNQMAKDLRQYDYPMPLSELKEKLIEALPELYSLGGKMLIFDNDKNLPILSPGRSMEISKELDEGFTYQGRFYQNQELEIDFSDFLKADLGEHWEKKLKDFFRNDDFHLLEDRPERFLLVKGGDVFEGEAAGPFSSRLKAKEFSRLVRGPLKISINPFPALKSAWRWWELLKIEQSPVVLEKSLPYAVENPSLALRFFYLSRPEEAAIWEARALSPHSSK